MSFSTKLYANKHIAESRCGTPDNCVHLYMQGGQGRVSVRGVGRLVKRATPSWPHTRGRHEEHLQRHPSHQSSSWPSPCHSLHKLYLPFSPIWLLTVSWIVEMHQNNIFQKWIRHTTLSSYLPLRCTIEMYELQGCSDHKSDSCVMSLRMLRLEPWPPLCLHACHLPFVQETFIASQTLTSTHP